MARSETRLAVYDFEAEVLAGSLTILVVNTPGLTHTPISLSLGDDSCIEGICHCKGPSCTSRCAYKPQADKMNNSQHKKQNMGNQ